MTAQYLIAASFALTFHHARKDTVSLTQLPGRAGFGHRAVCQYHDLVSIGDGAHTVGDDEHRLVPDELGNTCLDFGFVLHVERSGSFVQQHDRSIFQQGSGDGDTLALAPGERAGERYILPAM